VDCGDYAGREVPLFQRLYARRQDSPSQFKNVRILRILAQKMRIMATMPQLLARESNKQRKNTLVRSARSRRSAEFLELVPCAELKDIILLV
jgi:hypothetical protein